MSTEYRRGIPSREHIEAATRLGLEWERTGQRWRFAIRNGEVWCDFLSHSMGWDSDLDLLDGGRIIARADAEAQSYRPIRTDGTPVDWEVLDQEVARVGQQGQPVTVTPITSAAPTMQPQGFRADLWRRICRHFISAETDTYNQVTFDDIVSLNDTACHFTQFFWDWRDVPGASAAQTDILASWTVYQELKPLYDLVDGAQGEAAMPRDVEIAWYSASVNERRRAVGNWILARDVSGLLIKNNRNTVNWRKDEPSLGAPLHNFAAVLDAVAERRVAERRQGQTRTSTVTLPVDPSSPRIPSGTLCVQTPQGVRPATAQPEPRRFADVRPDRHGWRWWRLFGSGCGQGGTLIEADRASGWRVKSNGMYMFDWNVPNSSDADRTVIPTDEQGNPVSWESIAQAAPTTTQPQPQGFRADLWRRINSTILDSAQRHEQWRQEDPQLWREALRQAASSTRTVVEIYRDLRREAHAAQARLDGQPSTKAFTTNPRSENSGESTPLPRFTTDELDDVDHSQSTKLDNTPLKRGKLPTAEQIGKYREVMARRSGTVAEALKASGIDCEVAQYVLDRWADGLSDETALWLLRDVGKYCRPGQSFTRARIDELAEQAIERPALDTSEPVDGTAQRQREEREAQRQRMAALQAQLAAERAALRAEPQPEPTRFDLLECDPEANPVASIAAWEARMAQRSVQRSVRQAPVQRPQPIPQPTHRRPFEVVDAQADGLTGGAALAVLLGRAMNGGC